MATPPAPSIREVILAVIQAQQPKGQGQAPLTQTGVLNEVSRRLGAGYSIEVQEAVLTQWGELFRTGLLAWGLNLSNPDPPFFHLTARGKQALSNATRDPSNPAGYLRHLASVARLNPVAMSYLTEGLECYVAGLFKAAAVMVGAAAESTILGLRDTVVQQLSAAGNPVASELSATKIKTITAALRRHFDGVKVGFTTELRDQFDAYWSAFSQQIRVVRNDVGHPKSVDPVTPESVHASLLVFPELARLVATLDAWVHAQNP